MRGLEQAPAVCQASSDLVNVIREWGKAIVMLAGKIDNLYSIFTCKRTDAQRTQSSR